MMYPLVLDLAVDGIPVTVTCDVLGFSPRGFYKWRQRPCSDRDFDDARLVNKIIDIHADEREFGYRFIADELEASGVDVIFDDRAERPGVKYADNDLMGFPYQVIVGKRGLANGTVELKCRATGEREDVALAEVAHRAADLVKAQRA